MRSGCMEQTRTHQRWVTDTDTGEQAAGSCELQCTRVVERYRCLEFVCLQLSTERRIVDELKSDEPRCVLQRGLISGRWNETYASWAFRYTLGLLDLTLLRRVR